MRAHHFGVAIGLVLSGACNQKPAAPPFDALALAESLTVKAGAIVKNTLQGRPIEKPVIPPFDELVFAESLTVMARGSLKNTLRGAAIEPDSILANLVEEVRTSYNKEAKALLSQAEKLSPRATTFDSRPVSDQAHGLVLRAVTMVTPDAYARIYDGVSWARDRAWEALGTHEAPRIRRELEYTIAGQLRAAMTAYEEERYSSALNMSLRAWDRLMTLADHVAADSTDAR